MRTQIAFALAAASAAAVPATQVTCDAYYNTNFALGWTCVSGKELTEVEDVETSCTNTNAALATSGTIESGWDTACKKDDGTTWFAPTAIVGTVELCDAYKLVFTTLDADWVATDAEKKTFAWATACGGVDGATSMTTFGVAIVAAIAALAF